MSLPAQVGPATPDRRLLAAFALLAALASVYLTRTADADLWGHLRYGRLFVETRGLPAADPFAFTSADRPWSSHEYLSQVLLWLAYAAGGPAGLVVLKCLVGGAAVFFLYAGIRLASDDPRAWAPVLLLTAPAVGRWLLFRPQLFTFFFFALFVWLLFRALLGRPARLWLLPPATALWVNLHGGFLAGIGAVGLALGLRALQAWNETGLRWRPLARATGPLALTLVGCLAASLLNPRGWRLWPYLATELTCDVNRRFIEEWQPLSLGAHGWTAVCFFALVGLLLVAALLAGRRPVAGLYPWQWLLACLPLTLLACGSVRHVPIATLWMAPVLALLTRAAEGRRQKAVGSRQKPAAGGQLFCLLPSAFCLLPAARGVWLLTTGLASVPALLTVRAVLADPAPTVSATGPVLGEHAPNGAVAFLRGNGLRGRVYNSLWWGSYLTWELYPDVLVSMDGRNVTLFSPELVGENLSFYLAADADPEAPLRHRPDFLLVPADAPVLPRLRADRHWALLFDDGHAALFAPAGAQGTSGRLVRPDAVPPLSFR
jgi:hypothetical protein